MRHVMRLGGAVAVFGGLMLLVSACSAPDPDLDRHREEPLKAAASPAPVSSSPAAVPAAAVTTDTEIADERIQKELEGVFADEKVWKGREIEIVVRAGEVKLTGKALSQDDKDRITAIVSRVDGVKDVVNRLEIKS